MRCYGEWPRGVLSRFPRPRDRICRGGDRWSRANPEERSAQPADAASREQNSLLSFGGSFCYTVKPDTNITPDSGHVFFSL